MNYSIQFIVISIQLAAIAVLLFVLIWEGWNK